MDCKKTSPLKLMLGPHRKTFHSETKSGNNDRANPKPSHASLNWPATRCTPSGHSAAPREENSQTATGYNQRSEPHGEEESLQCSTRESSMDCNKCTPPIHSSHGLPSLPDDRERAPSHIARGAGFLAATAGGWMMYEGPWNNLIC